MYINIGSFIIGVFTGACFIWGWAAITVARENIRKKKEVSEEKA